MTRGALEMGLHKSGHLPVEPSATGIIISIPAGRNEVRVLRDGRKTIETYHKKFWEPYGPI
jgi:hypothetical protein